MKQPNPITGYKVDKSSLISLEKGKIPPQALDLEEVVLGAMMIDKKGVDEVIDILSPEAFYKEAHKFIFEATSVLKKHLKALFLKVLHPPAPYMHKRF